MKDEKVSFDPGFSSFFMQFPAEIPQVLDMIAGLKQLHQKKFEFQKLEGQLVPVIKQCAAVYLGCILWGCYLFYRYKDDIREISGNTVKESDVKPEYEQEMDFILDTMKKLDKASNYYLKRPFRLDSRITGYFAAYREFAALNNGFIGVETTSDIKIPESFKCFENYSHEQLEVLKENIRKVIASGSIEGILELFQ